MDEQTTSEKAPALRLPPDYKRPPVEEFVRSGYAAKDYDSYFEDFEKYLAERYASWQSAVDEEHPMGLPFLLQVRSEVRRQNTRLQRMRSPTRHRFKQYLFSDPSKRLIRRRPIVITAQAVVGNLDELITKERLGILGVFTPDGRRVNLKALKDHSGDVLGPRTAPVPLPHPPLDSAANDIPAGEAMPSYVDGTFLGDPAADRVLTRMIDEKEEEADKIAEAEGVPPDQLASEASVERAYDPLATKEDQERDAAPPTPRSEVTEPTPTEDPAAVAHAGESEDPTVERGDTVPLYEGKGGKHNKGKKKS